MSKPAERAYSDLIGSGEIDEPGALEADGKLGGVAFSCALPIPVPNVEGLPGSARFRVRLPVEFPHAKVEFVPLDSALHGFAHQDRRTGALCLKPGDYPHGPSARLRAYVDSAKGWLADAAQGTLLEPGQHWELPDFRSDREDSPPELLYVEDATTFSRWASRIGQWGDVQFAAHAHNRGLVPVRFARVSETVLEAPVGDGFLDRQRTALGVWLMLPSFVVARHRSAGSFRELEALCNVAHVDLWHLVRRSIKRPAYQGFHYVLVGAPIPEMVGNPDTRVHWQPIVIAEKAVQSFRGGGRKRRPVSRQAEQALTSRLRGALRDQAIPWGTATAFPAERADARGTLPEPLKRARVCVLGCGAIGSLIAEHLARGGVRDLSLFDGERLDLENLSRHPLSPVEVGQNKALAQAKRLNGIHPNARVRGFPLSLPLDVPTKANRIAFDTLQRADVTIDCTANDMVFQWASERGREQGKLVAHLFINAYAKMLTLCSSGRHASCAQVARKLFKDIDEGATGFLNKEYSPDVEEIFPGAGCWHPTFPGLGSNIANLLAAAVPAIAALVVRSRPSYGTAVVFRRCEIDLKRLRVPSPASVVEVAWAANYR
jgi:hypothetical protein